MVYLGFDLSITSPCLSIIKDDFITVYFYSKYKSHKNFYYKNDKIELVAWEYPCVSKKGNRIDRYNKVLEPFIEIIDDWFLRHKNEFKFGVEGYSYGSIGQSFLDLAEIGGIFRQHLYKKGIDFIEYPPKSIKKFFTGNGNASKYTMYLCFKRLDVVDLQDVLSIKVERASQIPHPVEDIVDSVAIALYLRGDVLSHTNVVNGVFDNL